MTECAFDYAVHYRWEWFARESWRGSFRERKRHSSVGFAELLRERGLASEPVLDCSCGLGLKTIVMREAGLEVHGSDGCAEAVELARAFAAEQGHPELPCFVSSWAELPERAPARYAAVFNDALSWLHSEEEMAASLKGLHDCLLPGGLLAYMGALPGPDADREQFLEREWERQTAGGRHRLGLRATVGDVSVQEVVFLERGPDYIDEHHVYVVTEAGETRAENWCVRCSLKWSWSKIRPLLEEAGFSSFEAKEFVAAGGKPFHLVVVGRD
jgi:SAM-dependent methyltransferase